MAEKTFFSEIHRELGAKTVPCGKWDLPLFYPGGSAAEHRQCCTGASVFDMTGTVCIQISGNGASAVLDKLFLRSTASLSAGDAQENALLFGEGTVALVFILCCMQEDDLFLFIERGTPEKNIKYLFSVLPPSLTVNDFSGVMAQLLLCGPTSAEVLTAAGASDIPSDGHCRIVVLQDDEADEFRCIAVRCDRFGMPSYHLCFNADAALEVYGAIYRINGVSPAGIGAWESLRVEHGHTEVSREIHDGVSPAECGLGKWIDRSGRDFCGRRSLLQSASERKIVRIRFGRYPASQGSVIFLENSAAVGVVVSSAFCPVSGAAEALCSVDLSADITENSRVICRIKDEDVTGTVISDAER